MAKFDVRPNRRVLLSGQTVTPEDVIATIDVRVEASVQDVLALLQFAGNATCVAHGCDPNDDESDSAPTGGPGSDVVASNDFDWLKDNQRESLTKIGVCTYAQAAMYLHEHGEFPKLKHVGPATVEKILEAIVAANFPVPDASAGADDT